MGIETFAVLGIPLGRLTFNEAIQQVNEWVETGPSGRLVTFANVHMVVEAQSDSKLKQLLLHADLNCPDGKPLSWIGRLSHGDRVSQIAGPDFITRFCEQSAQLGRRHYIYGGAPGVAEQAAKNLKNKYPELRIVGTYSPPFRPLSASEQADVCREINESGAQLVWVCLGCPKQEKWMFEYRDQLSAKVLLGVGQAVDILAGAQDRAPEFLRRVGLEWAYRLVREPRRLWKRYLVTNCLFLFWTGRDALFGRRPVANRESKTL